MAGEFLFLAFRSGRAAAGKEVFAMFGGLKGSTEGVV